MVQNFDIQEAASLLGANSGVVQNLAMNYVNKNVGVAI